jgi:hypothetical protein
VSFTTQGPVHVSDSDESPASARQSYFVRHLEQELESPNKPPDAGRHFTGTDLQDHHLAPAVPHPSSVRVGPKFRGTPERAGAARASAGAAGGWFGDDGGREGGAESWRRRSGEAEAKGDAEAAWRRNAPCNGAEPRKSSSRELMVEAVSKVRVT